MEIQRTPAQWYSLLAGIFLVALGVLTLVLEDVGFGTGPQDAADFLIWQGTAWNTILWMAMGGLGILASLRVDSARLYGMFAAVVFGALAIWGFIDGGADTMGIFSIGTVGNITHAALAGLGLLAALPPERMQRATQRRPPDQREYPTSGPV